MNSEQLFLALGATEWRGAAVEVIGVEYDSRRVGPGDVFVAMRGGSSDGNRFIDAAVAKGASAVVTDSREAFELLRMKHQDIPAAQVSHGRRALAGISAAVFQHPEKRLALTGVTGTNGKTTTAFLLEALLRSVERKCVLIGTIETHVGDEVRASEHTTPESRDVLQVFADGVAVGATEAVMEMSSHALEQERVWGLPVDVAIFTNLTQDHLDYHGTMERYFAAKMRLFEGVGAVPPRVAVVNTDDEIREADCRGSWPVAGLDLRAEQGRDVSRGVSTNESRRDALHHVHSGRYCGDAIFADRKGECLQLAGGKCGGL